MSKHMNICDCVKWVHSQRITGDRTRFEFCRGRGIDSYSLIFQSPFEFNLIDHNGYRCNIRSEHLLINDWKFGDPLNPQEIPAKTEGISFQEVAAYDSKIPPKDAPRFRNHHFSREMGFTFSHLIMLMGEMQKSYGHCGTQMVWDCYFRLNDWSVVK